MKYSLLLVAFLGISSLYGVETAQEIEMQNEQITPMMQDQTIGALTSLEEDTGAVNGSGDQVLSVEEPLIISVTGQGVAPMNTKSPAQAYALAKRAAIADGYRLIAEKVKGVKVDGHDVIKNMMVKRSTVRTAVHAMVKNANVVETTFKEGLCEVEMEITLLHSDFAQ